MWTSVGDKQDNAMKPENDEKQNSSNYIDLATVADDLGVSEATLFRILKSCTVSAGIMVLFSWCNVLCELSLVNPLSSNASWCPAVGDNYSPQRSDTSPIYLGV